MSPTKTNAQHATPRSSFTFFDFNQPVYPPNRKRDKQKGEREGPVQALIPWLRLSLQEATVLGQHLGVVKTQRSPAV